MQTRADRWGLPEMLGLAHTNLGMMREVNNG
jgi:hypothetical protein